MKAPLSNFNPRYLQRPYWLLLVLALFIAGQVATAAHWHAATAQTTQLDADCALCMLSSANGAAAIADVWQPRAVAVGAPIFLLFVAAVRRVVAPCYDSRAPPRHS